MNPKTKAEYEETIKIQMSDDKKDKFQKAIGKAFVNLDKDNSNTITLDELEDYMKENGLEVENIKEVFQQADKNKNEKITKLEWFVTCLGIYTKQARDFKSGVNCSYDILEIPEYQEAFNFQQGRTD